MNHINQILIVDGDSITAKTLSKILEIRGYATTVACSGHEAIELVTGASEPFDCIIADIHTPDISGVDLIHQIRIRQPQSATILMTGFAPYSLIKKGLDEGAIAVLDKPLNIKELLGLVADSCRRPVDDSTPWKQSTERKMQLSPRRGSLSKRSI